jgi:replicative superfamily II helicase
MKYSVLTMLHDGTHRLPGDVIDIEDKNEAKRLIDLGVVASVPTTPVASSTGNSKNRNAEAIEELMQIEGVTQEIAIALFDAGYVSIADIQKAKVETVVALKIKNVGKATAEKLIAFANDNFEIVE